MNSHSGNKRNTFVKVLLIVFIAMTVFIMFPRISVLKDGGGTVCYESFPLGIIYEIQQRHSYIMEKGVTYQESGTIIYIFGKEIYNSSHIDYDHPAFFEHTSEEKVHSK